MVSVKYSIFTANILPKAQKTFKVQISLFYRAFKIIFCLKIKIKNNLLVISILSEANDVLFFSMNTFIGSNRGQ